MTRRLLCCAAAAFWAVPTFASGVSEFDQVLPQAAQAAAIIGTSSEEVLPPVRGVWVEEREPAGRFELITIVIRGCGRLQYHENRSNCFSGAALAIGGNHLDAISRACAALTRRDQDACYARSFNLLAPNVFRDYNATKLVIRTMCTRPDISSDQADCFNYAAGQAGGHFLLIREVCGSLYYYENQSGCFQGALVLD